MAPHPRFLSHKLCVCGCNKYSGLKHSCTARKRILAALAPVAPPLHAFSLFLHACIGRAWRDPAPCPAKAGAPLLSPIPLGLFSPLPAHFDSPPPLC